MPTPEIVTDALPAWVQIAAGAGVFVFTVYTGIKSWSKNLTARPEPAQHVVLESAALADMRPVRELNQSMHDVTAALKEIAAGVRNIETLIQDALEKQTNEAEIDRRAEQKAAQILSDRLGPRRRPGNET